MDIVQIDKGFLVTNFLYSKKRLYGEKLYTLRSFDKKRKVYWKYIFVYKRSLNSVYVFSVH